MIEKKPTWKLVKRPEEKKSIGMKWIFISKLNANDSIYKHKAILVVKAFLRRKFVLSNLKDLQSNGMYQLKKALYGLKQAPRAWYNKIDEHLVQLGFRKCLSEVTLYIKGDEINVIIISLYVDDILVMGINDELVKKSKEDMQQTFEMTDFGERVYFLGIEIKQGQNEVFICQNKYAKDILKKFRMENCKETTTLMCEKEKLRKNDEAEKMDETLYRCLFGCCNFHSF
ncbi:hypothetical protein MTR67_044583 [Solanum verrucosum]|uniref:Reverse transcriptase Ty1/copia-type domain-containing protein n=1 Tax=Solanum verrucosum TaxID=315347 RepID=A0AAF0ZVE4_SOLVR|nr:hypothetical protein MTR67_044583 [Solanum verrucosum]